VASDLERSLRFSTIDGVFANAMGTITAGLFLTGFIIALGGSSSHIGAASSLPLFANVFQLIASYLIERTGAKKKICLVSCLVSRSTWLLFAALPLFRIYFNLHGETLIWSAISVYFLATAAASFAGIAWNSWMRDLVPEQRRGKYFGMRSAVTSLAGLVAGIVFGRFLDVMKQPGENYYLFAYTILFSFAFAFGMASSYFLSKVEATDVAPAEKVSVAGFVRMLTLPLGDRPFRRAMIVNIAWLLSCQLSSPFFDLFILRDLKVSFTMMAIYNTINLAANISMFSVWGRLSDHFGNKPVLLITTTLGALIPLIMVFANQGNAWLLVPLFEFSLGLVWSGINLTTSNIFLKLSPAEHNSIFLSLNSALNGLLTALGPAIGGFIAYRLSEKTFEININYLIRPEGIGVNFSNSFTNLQVLFLISVMFRVASAYFFRFVEEPRSRPFKNLVRIINHGRGFGPAVLFTPLYDYISIGAETLGRIEEGVSSRVRKLRDSISGNRTEKTKKNIKENEEKGKD